MSDILSSSSLKHLSDHDLIAQALLGASAAFGELARRHGSSLRTHLRRMGAQGPDADDMAQEAFVAAFERLSEYRADGPFVNWLKMIASRRYLRKLRKTQKYLFVDDMQAFEPAPDIHEHRASEGRTYDLDGALSQLKPTERLCVTLNFSGGLSHQEVATETGLPLGTVKSHIKRALASLKSSLGAVGNDRAAI
ncbi:sigma-70 family RNA polymerase sigma factor [Asticcacaulis sp. BYS171W]|uniref:Sigma-70 family RNA polymerase sigma factor n=1 Tax=Asticcacaulis aquaticus TaxID=2984212 RepID=A0ABT5HPM8_9CAUL|nr:sigma-70 family RNA polymerase sigma factor [Asticcacaulis aquaticus]MDC7682022.1 sigma-70 family RNA polymerase sigma factor [Asticcacaulis aquaticus]